MIVQQAAQCSILYMLAQTFLGGMLGSLGFVINMVIIGSIYRWYNRRKQEGESATEAVKNAAAGFISKMRH